MWRQKSERLSRLQQFNQGRKILHNWLGDGGNPVPKEQAQHRASVCISCPMNYKGAWIWQMATAIAIGSQMRLRETMKISLEGEDEIGVCEVCGCQLKLKVHVPFMHIYRHTPEEQFAKFPDECWQRQELKQIQKTTNQKTA